MFLKFIASEKWDFQNQLVESSGRNKSLGVAFLSFFKKVDILTGDIIQKWILGWRGSWVKILLTLKKYTLTRLRCFLFTKFLKKNLFEQKFFFVEKKYLFGEFFNCPVQSFKNRHLFLKGGQSRHFKGVQILCPKDRKFSLQFWISIEKGEKSRDKSNKKNQWAIETL